MGWNYSQNQQTLPIVKYKGICRHKARQRICPYWVARYNQTGKRITSYHCNFFDVSKESGRSELSVPECNSTYGKTYDGNP